MSLTALLHSQSYLNCFKGVAISRTIRIICFTAVFFLFGFVAELKAQTATITVSDNDVCQNATSPVIIFTGTGGTGQYTFTYTINGGAPKTTGVSTGGEFTLPVPTGTARTYNYVLVSIQDNDGAGAPVAITGQDVTGTN